MIFAKLGMCIDIVEIWFGIAIMGRFHQFLTELSFIFLFLFHPTDSNFLRNFP